MEDLDEEFREILVAIVGSRDGAGAKKCVEWLEHGRVSILAVEFSPFSQRINSVVQKTPARNEATAGQLSPARAKLPTARLSATVETIPDI